MTAVTLIQIDSQGWGDPSECEVGHHDTMVPWTVIWKYQYVDVHMRVCADHLHQLHMDRAVAAGFVASALTATVPDSLSGYLIDGVKRVLNSVERFDLAEDLDRLWRLVSADAALIPLVRMRKARFLIGSAAFALLPTVEAAAGDDDHDGSVSA